jgi:hypothetical protein
VEGMRPTDGGLRPNGRETGGSSCHSPNNSTF